MPHKVKETVGMNEARRVILAMSKPLGEVANSIDLNVQEAEMAKKQINEAGSDIASLQENLKFEGYDIEYVALEYPRTVCAHPDCIKCYTVGNNKSEETVYSQICHERCTVPGIPTQTTNNPRLKSCSRMGWFSKKCSECSHKAKHHMHLTYDTKVIRKEFLAEDVQSQIQEKGDFKQAREEFLRKTDAKIAELQEEEKQIVQTSAKFGSFLKRTALIPYNDALGDYLDMCIEKEEKKPEESRNKALLSSMKNRKEEYGKQKETLDRVIGTGADENIQTPDEVMCLQNDLFQLKHNGQVLRKLCRAISITNSARNKSFGEKIAPIPQKNKQKTKSNKLATWGRKKLLETTYDGE